MDYIRDNVWLRIPVSALSKLPGNRQLLELRYPQLDQITSYLLLIGSLNGSTYQLLWPGLPWLHNQAMMLTVPGALIFTLLFSRAFLNLRSSSPKMDRLVWYTVLVNLAVAVITFITDYSIAWGLLALGHRNTDRLVELAGRRFNRIVGDLPGICPDHATDANTLIRRAYIAQGSQDARDRGLAFYQPSRDSYSADRLTLVSELRHALQNNGLALYLQPKMSLKTREVVGLEALLRWPEHKNRVSRDGVSMLPE
ncbi:MAG: 7TM diverse intracellular signaling domain-containing protein [Marinobacter sp.]